MTPSTASAAIVSPRYAAFYISLGMWGHGYDATKTNASRYYDQAPDDTRLGIGSWRPATAGAITAANLPVHLAPFASLRQKMMILSGLSTLAEDPDGTDVTHALATSAWLTSGWRSSNAATAMTTKNNPPTSIDQFIANAMGITPGSTLVLNPSAADDGEITNGVLIGHHGYVSYNEKLGGNNCVPKITDPMKAFNQLFGACKPGSSGPSMAQLNNKSILDYVLGSIGTLQKKLGKEDSARLDAYLQNIRDLEVSLTAATPVTNNCPATPVYDPALNGSELDWVAKMRMMADVTALAMASDAMPIATIMSDSEANGDAAYASRVSYASDFVGLSGKKVTYHANSLDTHFDITHAAGADNTQAVEEWFAYTRLSMNIALRLAAKLDSMPAEPNGNTPLDNSILQIGCAHAHAADHKTHNIPTILLGGKKFGMHQGQAINLPFNTDMGDFYYTMLQAMQVPGASFNGRNKILTGLFG